MDHEENPTPPAESVSGTPQAKEKTERRKPSVAELLAAARGESIGDDASRSRVGSSAPKEVPASTPASVRAAPSTGAALTASTPTPSVNKGVSGAVASRASVGTVVESTPDAPVNKMRRRVVWASVTGFLGVSLLMFFRFFLPRSITEPSSIFRIGFPGDYSFGVDTKWQPQYRVWVVRNAERLFVINAVCTHLGCTPDWKSSENKFKCPCHGSGYDSEGINFEGPAPRPMDRAEVSLDAEGQIVVNKGRLYIWEKGKESQFDNEGAYIRV